MSDVTRILEQIEGGDGVAAERLLPLVYDELKRLAAAQMHSESPGHTLQATALVHEAYVRLVDVKRVQSWRSRGHFYAAAAEAMRRILIERARGKRREKRGGDWKRVDFENFDPVCSTTPEQLVLARRRTRTVDRTRQDRRATRFIALLRRPLSRRRGGIGRRFCRNRISPLGLRTSLAQLRIDGQKRNRLFFAAA